MLPWKLNAIDKKMLLGKEQISLHYLNSVYLVSMLRMEDFSEPAGGDRHQRQ